MGQFKLTWDNTLVAGSSNTTHQIAYYRRKSTGGFFIFAGFTPSNPMAISVSHALTPTLLDNVVYEFKVECDCTQGGPTFNDNGIREFLNFGCEPTPTITPSGPNNTISTISYDTTGTDINKVRFILKRVSDSLVIYDHTFDVVSHIATGVSPTLDTGVEYQWYSQFGAIVNGVQQTQVGTCTLSTLTTICPLPVSVTVTAQS